MRWRKEEKDHYSADDRWRVILDQHQETRAVALPGGAKSHVVVWVNHYDLERRIGPAFRFVSEHATLVGAKLAAEEATT